MMMREWRCSPSRTTDASPRGAAETVSQYRNGPITEYREQYIAADEYKESLKDEGTVGMMTDDATHGRPMTVSRKDGV